MIDVFSPHDQMFPNQVLLRLVHGALTDDFSFESAPIRDTFTASNNPAAAALSEDFIV